MIVPMKKIILLVLASEKERALTKLRELGIVHLEASKAVSQDLEKLKRQKELLERALTIPSTFKKPVKVEDNKLEFDPLFQAERVKELQEKKNELGERKKNILSELERLAGWGTIEPKRIAELKAKGIFIYLLEAQAKDLKSFPPEIFILAKSKEGKNFKVFAASFKEEEKLPGKIIKAPSKSTNELKEELNFIQQELTKIDKELARIAGFKNLFLNALKKKTDELTYEEARLSLESLGPVLSLTGYVPAKKLDLLKEVCSQQGWGLIAYDPEPEEDVPTLIEQPKPIKIIKPVFDFLGTVPGYREYDVSLPFLFFFSLFFAMLVGDAGYGIIFLAFSLIVRLVLKKLKGPLFGLLMVTGIATTIWGALTGTWFGSEKLAELSFLKSLIIEPIATFSKADNKKFLMFICFIIGLVHLSIAHLINIFRYKISFKGLTELGRLALVWGMFFMALNLVLLEPIQPATIWLVSGGLLAITFFEKQKPSTKKGVLAIWLNFLKGVVLGLASIFFTTISSISSLADIISYVRLFAVGLATVEIARTFNNMAAGLGEGLGFAGFLLGAIILFIGHALNMVLSLMSVLVHGIRLNMLEFSGHLGMEWSGKLYRPFALGENNNSGKET